MEDKRAYYARLIEEWKASDEPQKEFCARKGVKLSTYSYWNVKLNRERPSECRSLIEVHPEATTDPGASCSSDPQLVVGDYRVAVGRGFDRRALEGLISFLEQRGARA
jgi:hypothetical protein